MNLTKDTYLEIAKLTDDRTTVSMLSVNKKFYDDEFFKLVFANKYPLLVKFKHDESWKDFYLRMMLYIFKLNEEFNLDYIPSPKFNPQNFYKYAKNQEDEDWQLEAGEYLKGVKDLEFIQNFLQKYAKYLDFNHLIYREIKTNDLKRIKVYVDADVKAGSYKKFYSPVYHDAIPKTINKENIDLLEILILPNIRKYNLEYFIQYAKSRNRKLSEKYLLSRLNTKSKMNEK